MCSIVLLSQVLILFVSIKTFIDLVLQDITLDFNVDLKTSKELKVLKDLDSVNVIWDHPGGDRTVGRWIFKPNM